MRGSTYPEGIGATEALLPPLASVPQTNASYRGYPAPVDSLGADPALSAERAETAGPMNQSQPLAPRGVPVTLTRGGAGDEPSAPAVDQWWLIMRDAPHQDAQEGKQLFAQRSPVPPEGHGGYDIQGDYGIVIDAATQTQFVGWSDWSAATALQAGGRGAFTGEHVVIARIVPGSVQGNQPAEMLSPNVSRTGAPSAWDTAITVGGLL